MVRGTFLGLLVATAVSTAAEVPVRPNFLFILADDVTYSTLGCYGGKDVRTPNIDRLAQAGIKFRRAYCAMSMCAPFRAELYTGLYPLRSGVAWNHSAARPTTKSICHYLGALNYRVGLAGKKHAAPATVFPFEDVKGPLAGAGVRDFLTRDPHHPFCLFLCSNNAHPPWRNGDVSPFDPKAIKLPPTILDNPVSRKTYVAYLAEVAELDKEVGQILTLLDATRQSDYTLVMFSSEQGWDFACGKWTDYDIGIHTALIARWPGYIKPNSETDALVQMADIVPTFIEAAGGNPAACNLDGRSVLPVMAGHSTKHREFVYGLHNNVPEGRPYPIRSIRDHEFHYLINLKPEESYYEKHLMEDAEAAKYDLQWWKAMNDAAERGDPAAKNLRDKFHHRPAEELYRVDEDAYEMNNLANRPEYAAVKARLRAELARWMAEQQDPGVVMDDIAVYTPNRMLPEPQPPQKNRRK